MAPPLVESRYTSGSGRGAATRILLAGKEGPIGLMPPLGGALNDEQIASVLTYVRREWGNTGTPVSVEDVREVRGSHQDPHAAVDGCGARAGGTRREGGAEISGRAVGPVRDRGAKRWGQGPSAVVCSARVFRSWRDPGRPRLTRERN